MNKFDLIDALSSKSEQEVLIEIDGMLYEIEEDLGYAPAAFDGFDTVYPAAIVLKPKMEE